MSAYKVLKIYDRLLLLIFIAAPCLCLGAELSTPVKIASAEIVDVWQYNLTGTIDGRPIAVRLLRTGDRFNGFYRYAKKKARHAEQSAREGNGIWGEPLWLTGHFDRTVGRIRLTETRDLGPLTEGEGGNVSGAWDVVLQHDALRGTWRRGSKIVPIVTSVDTSVPPFPFQMKVRIHARNGFGSLNDRNHDPDCNWGQDNSLEYFLDEIYLYDKERRVQTLSGFRAGGACSPSFPRIRDIKFDGQPAIVLAITPGASAKHYYLLWTYDKVKAAFVRNDAWNIVQTGWDDPIIDASTKSLSVCWASSGSWPFGSKTYTWRENVLEETGRNECGDPLKAEGCRHMGAGLNYRALCEGRQTFNDPVAW